MCSQVQPLAPLLLLAGSKAPSVSTCLRPRHAQMRKQSADRLLSLAAWCQVSFRSLELGLTHRPQEVFTSSACSEAPPTIAANTANSTPRLQDFSSRVGTL